jgi:hypothetical protein
MQLQVPNRHNALPHDLVFYQNLLRYKKRAINLGVYHCHEHACIGMNLGYGVVLDTDTGELIQGQVEDTDMRPTA